MTLPQEKHVLLVSAAIILHQAGEDQRAVEILQDAIRQKPDNTAAHVLLGVSYQASGKMEQAEAAFRTALEIDPNNSEALQGFGLFLVSQGRYPEALPYMQNQLKKNPSDNISLDGLIDALGHLPGREKEIKAALRNAWKKTQNADLGIRYGRYILEHDNPAAARTVFAEVVNVSKTAHTLCELALTCFITDDCDCAIKLLLEAVEIDPQFDRAWRGLAQCYNEVKDYDKALEAAEQALAINPNHYRNWQAKADVFLSLGQFEKALETSQKGVDLIRQNKGERPEAEPVLAVLFLQRFNAYLALGKLDEAIAEASTARSEISTDGRFYLYPVEVLAEHDKPKQALEILDSASDPHIADLLAPLRYQVLHQLGRAQEAWDYIQPRLTKNTDKKLQVLANIGVDFYTRGFRESAMAVYRQLVEYKPGDVRFSTNLGYLLIGEARYQEAEVLLLRVIERESPGLYGQIVRCNLAYLYNLTGRYEKTLQNVEIVLNSEFAQTDAFLRTSFWINGQMLLDPAQYPGRRIQIGTAARACGATAALALGQLAVAERMTQEIKDEEGRLLQEMVLGCLKQARGSPPEAIQHWNTALKLSKSKSERNALKEWIQI